MPTCGASAKELAEIEVALMTQHFTERINLEQIGATTRFIESPKTKRCKMHPNIGSY
jgi:hypothetical protein